MKHRFYYDADSREIIDTAVSLDLLRVYARVPYHENGELIARLLNDDVSTELAQSVEVM